MFKILGGLVPPCVPLCSYGPDWSNKGLIAMATPDFCTLYRLCNLIHQLRLEMRKNIKDFWKKSHLKEFSTNSFILQIEMFTIRQWIVHNQMKKRVSGNYAAARWCYEYVIESIQYLNFDLRILIFLIVCIRKWKENLIMI